MATLKCGDRIRIGKDSEGNGIYATVVFIHPQRRFFIIEKTVLGGNVIRDTRYIGNRRGIMNTKIIKKNTIDT